MCCLWLAEPSGARVSGNCAESTLWVVAVESHPSSRVSFPYLCLFVVQSMLDFDFMCKREKPSVAAMVFPFSPNHYVKFYWGTDEIMIPVYQTMKDAFEKHPEVTVCVNFASFRSVYSTVMEMLEYSNQIKTIAIIAEGVPAAILADETVRSVYLGESFTL